MHKILSLGIILPNQPGTILFFPISPKAQIIKALIIIYRNVFTISPLPSTCPSFYITLSSSSESYRLLTFLCSFYFLWTFGYYSFIDYFISINIPWEIHITNYMSFTSFVNQYLPTSLEQILIWYQIDIILFVINIIFEVFFPTFFNISQNMYYSFDLEK